MHSILVLFFLFFFNATPTTEIYTFPYTTLFRSELAALGITVLEIMPIADFAGRFGWGYDGVNLFAPCRLRSEEHTSELQSHSDLVCRLLLEKKKETKQNSTLRRTLNNSSIIPPL